MASIGRAVVLAGIMAAAAAGIDQAMERITPGGLRAHIYFLAHDQLEGRGTGTRGGALAAEYIAAQFMRAGLQPLNGSYFQDVPIRGITTDPASVSLAFEMRNGRVPAAYPSQAVISPAAATPNIQVNGELVFVGYGIDAPTWAWDDFKSRDLTGKVLLFLLGDPPAPPEDPGLFDGRALTYYGQWRYKIEEARRQGAVGAILIHDHEATGLAWSAIQRAWTGERFVLDPPERGLPLLLQGWVTAEVARAALAGAGHDLDELYVQAGRRDFRPVATGVTVRARMNSRSRAVPSRNVLGYIPGTHAERGREVVVVTAHYDHLGVGAPSPGGDSIYNGAYDNASGVSLLIEVAAAFASLDEGPERSILFIATAAEEAGLLGSSHYVGNPLFPVNRTVAAINVHGANLWGETDDMIVLGLERSTLGEVARTRAATMNIQLRADPAPEQGSFFRSDHFPFARAGVPALHVTHGVQFRGRPQGWGERMVEEFQARHRHQPSDRYDPDFDLGGAVQQARFVLGLAYDVANAALPPRAHETSAYRAEPAPPTR